MLIGYHLSQFYSTSPGEFMTRLREHKEQNTTIKQAYGEEREFSSLLHPKEDIEKCHSPTFTKQKVKILLMKFNETCQIVIEDTSIDVLVILNFRVDSILRMVYEFQDYPVVNSHSAVQNM